MKKAFLIILFCLMAAVLCACADVTLNIDGVHVEDPPAGLDEVNWRAVLGLLYAKGYDGMLSIEPHSHTWQGDIGDWGVDYTIDYISTMLYKG